MMTPATQRHSSRPLHHHSTPQCPRRAYIPDILGLMHYLLKLNLLIHPLAWRRAAGRLTHLTYSLWSGYCLEPNLKFGSRSTCDFITSRLVFGLRPVASHVHNLYALNDASQQSEYLLGHIGMSSRIRGWPCLSGYANPNSCGESIASTIFLPWVWVWTSHWYTDLEEVWVKNLNISEQGSRSQAISLPIDRAETDPAKAEESRPK